MKEITDQKQKNNSWADIVSKEEAEKEMDDKIAKRLKEKDEEEKARKDRMKNIIVHGIDEAEGIDPLKRRASDIKEIQNILKDFCEVELKDEDIVKSMRLGKYDQTKKWPILITVKTEDKKKEIFQNLHKLRNTPNNISVAHDLTKNQREELQELIKEARKKEENDQSGNFMYRSTMGMVHQENKKKVTGTKSQPRNIINKISCMYTNVDQFHRKFPEFLI